MKLKKLHWFDVVNVLFMIFILFITAYPIYYVVIASFSDPHILSRTTGMLWLPIKPYTLDAYKAVFDNALILSGFKNTIIILVCGVGLQMICTSLGAYFLCIKGPMLKDAITFMIIFTMYFGGGMIPTYLNIRDLGMLNTLWSLIIPGAIGTGNMVILKSAFKAIPDSLPESAKLDGATHFKILTRIMLPLSKATLAVLVLYYGVSHWNSWFTASIYLRDNVKFPLQLVLRNLLSASSMELDVGADDMAAYVELVKYAMIVVTTAPILALYPFLQKYFVKGVMIGAVKG